MTGINFRTLELSMTDTNNLARFEQSDLTVDDCPSANCMSCQKHGILDNGTSADR